MAQNTLVELHRQGQQLENAELGMDQVGRLGGWRWFEPFEPACWPACDMCRRLLAAAHYCCIGSQMGVGTLFSSAEVALLQIH